MITNLKPLLKGATAAVALTLAASTVHAGITFNPLPASTTIGSLPANAPFALPAGWAQTEVFNNTQFGLYRSGAANNGSSAFDMITVNESGPDRGRYIFTVNETGPENNGAKGGGLVRYDRNTGQAVQLFRDVVVGGTLFTALDPVRWTPWGTIITGEEFGANGSSYRLIEVLNPLGDALGGANPVVVVDRPNAGRVGWEGPTWDAAGNFYFQDEDNSGAIYKFVPTQSAANFNPADPSTSPLANGQIFALQVNAADPEVREGAAVWVPLTDVNGNPLPGVTDPTVNIDSGVAGRVAANEVGATNFRRPEDMHVVVKDGKEFIIVAATTADNGTGRHHVYSLELKPDGTVQVRSFVDDAVTTDLATGMAIDAVADILNNPDNIAIDGFGDVWIIEDNAAGDIWKAEWGATGTAASVARFASLSTPGAEPTGLYFDPFDTNRMWVNVQHPSDGIDRMIELSFVPEPEAFALFGAGLVALGLNRRRQRKG